MTPIDDATKARVKRLADAQRSTPQALILKAITQYLDREEKSEAFRQDTLLAWKAFLENGLHVTSDEADAWMAELERSNDLEPPECHT